MKSPTGEEAYNDNGLVPRTIRLLKDKYPGLVIYTDVALEPYSSDVGVLMNNQTVHQLCKQAVSQARAGADVVSPSYMERDGRVKTIRAALDAEGFQHVSLMSYSGKYDSGLYGPFHEALDRNPSFKDKRNLLKPGDYSEALKRAREDHCQGANILLVTPALYSSDIVRLFRDNFSLPIAAYQASGEYAMIKAGGFFGVIDGEESMMGTLTCVRQAGADIIFTYFALEAARYLCGEKR